MNLNIEKLRSIVARLKHQRNPLLRSGYRADGSTFIYVPKSMVSEARAIGWDVEPWPDIPA